LSGFDLPIHSNIQYGVKGTLVLEEASVIAVVRAGNIDAFADVVDQYQTPIQRYLYRLTGDYELARDLTQDTFIKAYKNILKTNSELALKAWLYRIATNNAWQYYRRKRLISFVPSSGSKKVATTDDFTNEVDQHIEIEKALLKLPQKHRTCLVLHFVEGFKYREIAGFLGISEEAVRKRVARGSQQFRKLYSVRGGVR
jgi:RNA polymerase sigma-70 factor (ECF subfamily)